MRRTRRWALGTVCLAAASAVVSSPTAGAAVTIGQTGEPSDGCSAGYEFAQLTVGSGPSYFVPSIPPATALSITSWSHVAYPDPGQKLKLRVYRPVAGLTYKSIAEDIHDVSSGGLVTFPTNIAVQPGDTIGIMEVAPGPLFACGFGPGGETTYSDGLEKPIGSDVTFSADTGFRLNVSAVVEPTNTFSFGKTKRKPNGTAILALGVPNPGDVTVSGSGVKGSSASARTAKSVSAGTVKLKIKARGKKLGTLNRTGKVKLRPSITYTPTNGSPKTQSTKVKLKKSG
jgi:hypothetical protein